jgi:peptidoglycan/xylan/chitin deacetylase (PgdA/CDA1 family)
MTPFNNPPGQYSQAHISRRGCLATTTAAAFAASTGVSQAAPERKKAQIAITLDLEMSRMYPRRDIMEWDFQKGNLNEETKKYSKEAAAVASDLGGVIHYFCVGRVLEQPDVGWLKKIHDLGHPIGNHTYDHVNVWTKDPEKVQFRFKRSPWLIKGMSVPDILQNNIRITSLAMKQRLGFGPDGFRTPGGSYLALDGREDLQTLLLDEGFSWVSSKYPRHDYSKAGEPPTAETFSSIVNAMQQAQPYRYPTGLIEIPMSPISDVGAFRSSRWKREYFLKSIQQCVEWAIEHGAVFDFLCHPSIMYVEDPNFEAIKLICRLAEEAGDKAEIVGLSDIAKHVADLAA